MTTNQAPAASSDLHQAKALKGAKTVFTMLFFINLFNYIDRQVLYAVFPLIKTDLGLSDGQLGMLASAFMIVYMLVSPFIGYLADRTARPKLIAASAVLWSLATVACAGVKNYAQLLVARSFIGIGESGFTAISPSLVSEHFPARQRARVMALFTMALPIGSALGYLLGGKLGQDFGWRAAFLMVGVPGMLLGLMALTLRDPHRGAQFKSSAPHWREYTALFKNKQFMFACLSLAMSTFTLGGFAAWIPSFFTRYYGFSVSKAGMVFGAMTVVSGAIGTLIGGWFGDWLHKKTEKAYFIVTASSLFLATPFAVAGLMCQNTNLSLALLFVCEILIFINTGPLNAAVVAATGLEVRSMAFALNIFIIHVLGDATSPTIIGFMSDAAGLRTAMVACCVMLLAGGWFSVKGAQSFNKSG